MDLNMDFDDLSMPPHFYRGYTGYIDEHGKPIKRTPQTHPYLYEGFVEKRLGPNSEATGTVYSDRLRQWDASKAKACKLIAFGRDTDNYSSFSAEQIQTYLREYLDEPELKLILVMQYCNQSSGYPVWRFDYCLPKKED